MKALCSVCPVFTAYSASLKMVKVDVKKQSQTSWLHYMPTIAYSMIGFLLLVHVFDDNHPTGLHKHLGPEPNNADISEGNVKSYSSNINADNNVQCPINAISELTAEEQHPVAGDRHMVTPPAGGAIHLVCCKTSKGPLNIMVHEKWAPLGAGRFLEMVKDDYFSSTVPMMRCIRNFLCQFGTVRSAYSYYFNLFRRMLNVFAA